MLRDSTGCVEVTATHAIVPKVYICTCTPLFLVELVQIIEWQAWCMTATIVLSDWFLLAFCPLFQSPDSWHSCGLCCESRLGRRPCTGIHSAFKLVSQQSQSLAKPVDLMYTCISFSSFTIVQVVFGLTMEFVYTSHTIEKLPAVGYC